MATAVRPSKSTNFSAVFCRRRLFFALHKVRKCELCSRKFEGFHDHGDLYKVIVYHSFIHSSMDLQPFVGPWPLLQFRNLYYTDGRTPWTSDIPSQGRYLHTRQQKHRINAYTDIHALSGIRTHYPSLRAIEDSSCLKPCGHRNRRNSIYATKTIECYGMWSLSAHSSQQFEHAV
jgi:hypothetical protein